MNALLAVLVHSSSEDPAHSARTHLQHAGHALDSLDLRLQLRRTQPQQHPLDSVPLTNEHRSEHVQNTDTVRPPESGCLLVVRLGESVKSVDRPNIWAQLKLVLQLESSISQLVMASVRLQQQLRVSQ